MLKGVRGDVAPSRAGTAGRSSRRANMMPIFPKREVGRHTPQHCSILSSGGPLELCCSMGSRAGSGPCRERTMQRTKPPFRADQVGSLLRSAPVKEARTRRATGEITPAGLEAVEDAEIAKLVAKQEAIGLQAVTHGRRRRPAGPQQFLTPPPRAQPVTPAPG